MPKPVKPRADGIPNVVEDSGPMTVKNLSDEVESIRSDLWAIGERLNKLSWVLMTHGVKPGTAGETHDDIPF